MRRVSDNGRLFDRAIDGGSGKLHWQRRRRRGEGGAQGCGGNADGAKVVGPVIGRMVLGPIAVRRSTRRGQRGGTTVRICPVKRMNVT